MARQNRTLKKVNKVLARVEKHIEETRDALEDLEIEFEVLKATVKRLKEAPVEAAEPVEEVDEEIDIENSTNITMTRNSESNPQNRVSLGPHVKPVRHVGLQTRGLNSTTTRIRGPPPVGSSAVAIRDKS